MLSKYAAIVPTSTSSAEFRPKLRRLEKKIIRKIALKTDFTFQKIGSDLKIVLIVTTVVGTVATWYRKVHTKFEFSKTIGWGCIVGTVEALHASASRRSNP